MNRFLATTERFLEKAIDVVVVLVLLIGAYYMYDSYVVYQGAGVAEAAAFKPSESNPAAYQAISDDCVAWITLYNTGVDYPIMQGADNFEYLNKDPFGAYSLSGSIFLDSRNAPDFTDDYSLVYGHHVSNNYMFGALDAFEDRAYFDAHREGELVINGQFHKVQSFAFAHTDTSEGIIFDPDRPGDRIAWIKDNCTFMEQPAGSRIVALSTCVSPTSASRTILFVAIED